MQSSNKAAATSARSDRVTPAGRAIIEDRVSVTLADTVRPWGLLELLERAAPHLEILSLDCFDTLLWRRTRTPGDLFFDLAKKAPFARLGLNARLRMRGEGRARSLQLVRKNRREVGLPEIYRGSFPDLGDDDVQALAEAELQTEIETCFGFGPVARLIREAKKKGLRVIIVSDTYFNESQLRRLLEACLDEQTYGCIERVYCSSDHGKSKSEGLFGSVVEHLRVRPERILHLGDNPTADCVAPRRKGVAGIHLDSRDSGVEEVLRLTALSAGMMAPELRGESGTPSSFHGLLSERRPPEGAAAELGYLALGPILYAFAEVISAEVKRMSADGQCPKVVFLLRDAYLPSRVFQQLHPETPLALCAISRFVSYASSFRSKADIEDYLARSAGATRFEAMLKQLLLSEKSVKFVLEKTQKSKSPRSEFVKQVLKERIVKEIISASARYRKRLVVYLEKTVDLKDGDTLLFVDLGYEGTAQRELAPVLWDEHQVTVRGCYLMASRVPGWEKDRVGLLDPGWCDDRILGTLVPYVALIEDLCTKDERSVIDYTEQGEPLRADHVIEESQFARIRPVQDECLRFANDAKDHFATHRFLPSLQQLKVEAMASLARLLFFPTEREIGYLEGFRLDMNMGTIDSFALFDREAGLAGLRERGLFFMEKTEQSIRMNYPVELRSAGLELSMLLLAQHRFGCELHQADFSQRRETFHVLVLRGGESAEVEVEARATYDGCFAAIVPVSDLSFDLGILFGQRFEWLQLVALDLVPADVLFTERESVEATPVLDELSFEKIRPLGNGLLQVESSSGFAFLSPGARPRTGQRPGRKYVVRVVFRPLVPRTEGTPEAANENALRA